MILRFVLTFGSVQLIAVAGCLLALKKHTRPRAWLVALGIVLYLNCAYFFLFSPVGMYERFRTAIDYLLVYPFFAYMLVCLALAPLFAVAAAAGGVIRCLAALSGRPPRAAGPPDCNIQRRNFLRAMAAGVAAPVAVPSLYGLYIGSARLRIDEVPAYFPDLPRELDGFTIIQVSDPHVGPFMDGAMLQRIVGRINGMAPDMVAITGDIINLGSEYIDEAAEGLAGLQAEYGVYGVLGNHDFYCDTALLCAKLERAGVQMLRNDWRDIRLENGGILQIAGIDDPRLHRGREMHEPHLGSALRSAPEGRFRVLLSHRPTAFEAAAQRGCRLTLAGHTHAGQLIVPLGGGRSWSCAKLVYERDHGLFALGAARLYVNRGLGVVGPPLRINCPREITRLVLRRGNPAARSPNCA